MGYLIKCKKIKENAIILKKAYDSDVGTDIYTCGDTELKPNEIKRISTGIALQQPKGYTLDIRPRSSMLSTWKLLHQYGTIDCYTGEIGIVVMYIGEEKKVIPHGTRLVQVVPIYVGNYNIVEVEELEETERGSNGFGSSGK